MGGRGGDGGEGDYNLPLHCHHQNGSCIKTGSVESTPDQCEPVWPSGKTLGW